MSKSPMTADMDQAAVMRIVVMPSPHTQERGRCDARPPLSAFDRL